MARTVSCNILKTLLLILFPFLVSETTAFAQGVPNLPPADKSGVLNGNWRIEQNQPSAPDKKAEIEWKKHTKTYTYKTFALDLDGNPVGEPVDEGVITPKVGGWLFASTRGGGAGGITHEGGNLYSWTNTQTGANGYMKPW